MSKYLIDIPVALIFFNRDDTLKFVFDRIKEAKPSKLFLIQDGARVGRGDEEGIERCRKIVEDIDWDCEVYKNYSTENLGCGRRVSSGISWAFEYVDRLVIIEDDCVIEPTFFDFSKELLEKYKDDDRVCMISALNHFKDWKIGENSYLFAKTGAIAAWATWKRVWQNFDFLISDFDEPYVQKTLRQSFHHRRAAKSRMNNWKQIYNTGKETGYLRFWGPQFGYLKYKSNGLAIVPSNSLSSNIGVGKKATFSGADLKCMKRSMRGWFYQQTRPMQFPLVHPSAILPDEEYDKKYYDITYPNPIVKFFTRVYYFIKRKLFYKK